MTVASSLSRRKLLAAVGGAAGLAGVGYAGARGVARSGVVTGRLVIGIDTRGDTVVDETAILEEFVDPDGPPDRRFHPDHREEFPDEPPMTVSASVHRTLRREFDDVDYALGHSCPNERCTTPQVSRRAFNAARLGEDVRLLYHSGDSATIVP